MRKLSIALMALFAITLSACDNDEEPENKPIDKPSITIGNSYTGTLSVDQNDGSFYTQGNTVVSVADSEGETVSIVMKKVKFSDKMPMTLDMTINKVSKTKSSKGYALSGDNIIPLAMSGEFPQYTITNLSGEVTDKTLTLEMICGNYPLTFSGNVK